MLRKPFRLLYSPPLTVNSQERVGSPLLLDSGTYSRAVTLLRYLALGRGSKVLDSTPPKLIAGHIETPRFDRGSVPPSALATPTTCIAPIGRA